MKTNAKTVLLSLSVTGKYAGYRTTVAACELMSENDSLLLQLTKELYPRVAERCGCSVKSVERNIRTIILHCWNNRRERLCEIAGYDLPAPPSVSEFLGLLAGYIDTAE